MKTLEIVFAALLITVFIGLSAASARMESLTYDEPMQIEEGIQALTNHRFVVQVYNPPLVLEIAAFPMLLLFDKVRWGSMPNMQAFPGRMAVACLGAVLLISVYAVTKKFINRSAAVFALIFLAFEPNILANSHYISPDIGFTLFLFIAYVSFLLYLKKQDIPHVLAVGISTGLACASKASAVPYLFFMTVFASALCYKLRVFGWWWRQKFSMLVMVGSALLVVWACYFFTYDYVIAPANWSGRVSDAMYEKAQQQGNTAVVQSIRFLKTTKLPLGTYFAMLKNAMLYNRQGEQFWFLGRFYERNQWFFIVVNVLMKVPIPLLMAFTAGIYFFLTKRNNHHYLIYLFIPVISIMLLSYAGNLQPKIRYVLPVIVFLAIIGGYGVSVVIQKGKVPRVILLLFIAWYVIGTLRQFPHFISYGNELAGPAGVRFGKFYDSNLDMGQGLISFRKYIEKIQPSGLSFSYFGRDDAGLYGFPGAMPFGSYSFDRICAFHEISYPQYSGPDITAITVTNWYMCGYYKDPVYQKANVTGVVADSILIFNGETKSYAKK